MTTTTEPPITAETVAEWRANLEPLRERLQALDAELVEVSAQAELGDAEAKARRKAIQKKRTATENRIRELQAAIESGEAHLRRLAAERREAERHEAAETAERLVGQMQSAAERFDAAMATAAAAYAEFRDLDGERIGPTRTAGLRASGNRPSVSLARALWHHLDPRTCGELKLYPVMRHKAPLVDCCPVLSPGVNASD